MKSDDTAKVHCPPGSDASRQSEGELAALRKITAEQEYLLASGERQRQFLQQQLEHLHHSLSWRLTAPIRKMCNWFSRLTGVLVAVRQSTRTAATMNYQGWLERYDTLSEADRAAIGLHMDKLAGTPRFSLLLPLQNVSAPRLRRTIASVRAQLYRHWELCIVGNDAVTEEDVHALLQECRQEDARIKVETARRGDGGAVDAVQCALDLATGEFIAVLDVADELAPHALYLLAVELDRFPTADILYSDEDSIDDDGIRSRPHFKSDWNPDLFYAWNYLSHLTVCRTELARKLGGFRREVEGSHEYDLTLRCLRQTTGERIRHLPAVLCHRWSGGDGREVAVLNDALGASTARTALADYFAAEGVAVTIVAGVRPATWVVKYPLPVPAPLVTLVIPTKDGGKVLRRCLESIKRKTTYVHYEILVVDNQSQKAGTRNYLAALEHAGEIRLLHYEKPFNYSAINNFAVSQAAGDIIGLLNDDVEVISPDWLLEMVCHAVRPKIGAVGALLYYPDRRIQHAGVILGMRGVAGHTGHGLRPNQLDTAERLQMVRNYSAVTGACLVVRKELYLAVGGLDERNLPVAYNDVDFCLRLNAAGYRTVWTPAAELYHHESVSRGHEETAEKRERWQRESQYMLRQWGSVINNDPCYNPNLTLEWPDCSLACPPRGPKPWLSI